MKRNSIRFLAIVGLGFAAGCGGGGGGGSGLRVTSLAPDQWGSFDDGLIVDDTLGGTGGDGMLEMAASGLEAIVVGWEHFYDGNRMHNHVYSGAVKFNVAAFIPSSKRTISKATLTYVVDDGRRVPSAGFFETDPMLMRLPTDDTWEGVPFSSLSAPPGPTHDPFPGSPYCCSEVPVGLIGGTVSMDVTAIVKEWALVTYPGRANTGIYFVSNDYGTFGEIADSNASWQILRDFRLTIEWTP